MKPIAIGVFLLGLSIGMVGKGDIVLDQSYSFASGVSNSTDAFSQIGQTFTVGVSGTLDHIDVFMFRLGPPFDPPDMGGPLLRVFNTSGGLPTGTELASVTLTKGAVTLGTPTFVTFDVSSFAIGVNIGDVLAYSISGTNSSTGPYFLPTDGGPPNSYTGGAAIHLYTPNWQFFSTNQDHSFKTFVNNVPEPSSFALILLAGTVLPLYRRRFSRNKTVTI